MGMLLTKTHPMPICKLMIVRNLFARPHDESRLQMNIGKVKLFFVALAVPLIGCSSLQKQKVDDNLYGTWTVRESRCGDMVVKSSVTQTLTVFKDHLILSVNQGECPFKNTMPYSVSKNEVTAIGPGQVTCSSKCPAKVHLINQLGGKDSMELECPKYEKDDTVDFTFVLKGERLIQTSKSEDSCDITYVKE